MSTSAPAPVRTSAAFTDAYAALNDAQRRAVDTVEGPLMVVAGPGTGKTQVVALRVANILQRTQVKPGNILCLTFSVSGATAMRERLRRVIGADAYGVEVTTIHGFCNDIIQRHPDVFADARLRNQATDVERYRMMNAILDALPPGGVIVHPKEPHARTRDILTRIGQCKREAVSVDDARDAARRYAVEMDGKSREGTKAHADNLRRAKQASEFAELYAAYEAMLRDRGLYDYDDMIAFATQALRDEDWLLASLQERFQYVLVDEYQDTNAAQQTVIATLTTLPEQLGEPNLCVVGDDDQAIYRFQGASVTGMLAFRSRFPECPVVTLTTSYRSTTPILAAAGRLIEQNGERLAAHLPDVRKNLHSGIADPDGPEPMIVRPASDAVEPFTIADTIDDLCAEGIPPREIAVLPRTNRELFALAEVFRLRGIPVQVTGKLDLLQNAAVLQAVALLTGVVTPERTHALADALGCDCLGVHPADLARVLAVARSERTSLLDVVPRVEELLSQAVMTLHDAPVFLRARDMLLHAHAGVGSKTLPATLEILLRSSGLIPADVATADPLDVVALTEFFSHVKERCLEADAYGVRQFLDDLSYRREYAIAMQYAIPHLVDDGVQLMTAHASKGLEFTVVIVPQFREKHWDRRRPLTALALPEELLFGASQQEGLEDERRLAYVAWTRAKRRLILSCPERTVRGEREQDAAPSSFAVEGGPLAETAQEVRNPEAASILLGTPRAIDGALEAFLRQRLETFELSVTALNRFLSDPQDFLREDLLALPRAKTASLAYGTAIHAALRAWGEGVMRGMPLTDEQLLTQFATTLEEHEILTRVERESLLHLGREDLPRFAAARLRDIPVVHAVEKKIRARLPGDGDGVPLKGDIDRMDLDHPDGANARIIDYKTGKPKTERRVREDYNGDLYRQLVFYKMLIRHSPQTVGLKPVAFVLEFIGDRDDEPRTVALDVPDSDVAALENLVRAVWKKILALDFTPLT